MFKMIKNRKLRIFIIILLILVILSIIIAFIVSKVKSNYRSFYKTNDKLVLEQSYNMVFNEIDINTKMTDIYIKKSDDNNTKVLIYGEEDYIKIDEKNNKLFINIKDKNFIAFDFYSYISKIELYLPSYYSNLIRITSKYGDVETDEFTDLTLYANQQYGNFLSKGIDFIKINNKSGNVELMNATKARISSRIKNIKIGSVDDLEIENKYGDIKIDNIGTYLKINNESGNIDINNIILEKDSYIETKYGNININNVRNTYISAKSDHGKVVVENNDKKSDLLLKVHNKSGDININNNLK